MKKEKISGRQAMWLMVIGVIGTGILFLPGLAAQSSGKDAWMAPIIATFFSFFLAYVGFKLAYRFPDKSLIEYLPTVTGSIFGKIIGFLYMLFFLYLSGVILREIVVFVVSAILNRTPPVVVTVMFMFAAALAVRIGIEVINRVNEWAFLIIIFSIALVVVLAAKEGDINNITPIFDNGIVPILKGSFIGTTFRGEIVLFLLMLTPALNSPGEIGLRSIQAVVVVGIILAVTTVTNSFVFEHTEASRMVFPTFELAKIINIANFLERFDPVVLVTWITGSFVKISLAYYITTLTIAQEFNLKDYRPLVLPVGIIITVLSLIEFRSTLQLRNFLAASWPFLAIIFEFIFPAIILLIALIRNKGQKKLKEDN